MKRDKKIKEIVSRPVKAAHHLKRNDKTVFNGVSSSNRNLPGKSIQSRFSDFNLEAEAARLAYRFGISTESSELYRIQGETEHESDEELEPIKAIQEEKEITRSDGEEVIEKLRKSIKMEEKEGWEAFYN